MNKFVITRSQFEKLKQAFEVYNAQNVVWYESSPSGIGPTVFIEFDSVQTTKIDITDVESW